MVKQLALDERREIMLELWLKERPAVVEMVEVAKVVE